MYNEELYHHGILGMHWGVRRYQNKDGTLTEAGKKRAAKLENEYNKLTKNSDSKNIQSNTQSKKISELTDEELNARIDRIKLEKRYAELMAPTAETEKKQSRGKKFVLDVLEASGRNIATQATTYALGAATNAIAKKLGVDAPSKEIRGLTDEELNNRIDRIKLEKRYDELTSANIVNPKKGQKDK